ncbi:c-di-GMP-specific phosphodiesterase class I [Thermodesulfovibrio aggregans]|uniref:C-di-GMP-specific phosphodiesterase class I n=1 Tax=Thermodesulfovibrio aggregans TaxID=86166 RepID=A0A0U9HTI8_9BACT|nr:c-di-GMP-specific phosphodiesterase class I [Thermodesulfovibrio aggregans]
MKKSGKCERCEILPEIFINGPCQIVFTAKADALLIKLERLLEKTLGLKPEIREDLLLYSDCEIGKTFEALISAELSTPEKEDIELAILSTNEPLNLRIFKRLKKLSYYLELYANRDFVEMLKEARLTVHFHTIIDGAERDIFGYECLTRGVKNNGDIVPPKILFEVAKMTDLLFYLDRASREIAIKTAAVKGIKEKKVFINFIPTAIYDPKFCLSNTIAWAYKMEYNPSNLVFEVVESHRVSDLKHLKEILDYYRENGFKVALDDVGSGFSNLESLVVLKPNYLKIDMEIVRDIHKDKLKQSICRALVDIAKENDIKTIAEGIETKEEFIFLRDLGIDYFQGFYFSKPAPEPIRKLEIDL